MISSLSSQVKSSQVAFYFSVTIAHRNNASTRQLIIIFNSSLAHNYNLKQRTTSQAPVYGGPILSH